MACVALACVGLAGCQRPFEHVTAPAAENLSRNVSATPPAAESALPAAPPPVRPPPAPEVITDTLIAARVGAALMADEAMRGADVSVNVEHGVVILAGNVKSYDQAGIASAYAQRQDGVMRVDNQLTLVPR
jgi:osmotically-inducible protein OsmY